MKYKSNTIPLFLCAFFILSSNASAKETLPMWVFTQFKEAKSATEPTKLNVGIPKKSYNLLEAECITASQNPTIPVTLFVKNLKGQKTGDEVRVRFFRGRFDQTMTGKIIEIAVNDAPAKLELVINSKAPLWNALLSMKGISIKVEDDPEIKFNFMRGSEQRVSNFLQNCRSQSVAFVANDEAEKIITRKYYCKDGSIINVKLLVAGTIPTATITHGDIENAQLKPVVSTNGVVYQNKDIKLEMQGLTATLSENKNKLTCSANLPQ